MRLQDGHGPLSVGEDSKVIRQKIVVTKRPAPAAAEGLYACADDGRGGTGQPFLGLWR